MLDFMREEKEADADSTETTEDQAAVSDNAHDSQDKDYLAPVLQDKNIKQSTILLVLIFGIGMLGLFFMIKKSSPSQASAATPDENISIAQAIEKLTGNEVKGAAQIDQITERFYEISKVRQVPASQLRKNPFRHESFFISDLQVSEFETENVGYITDGETPLKGGFAWQIRRMQLVSIIQTSEGNCCMIDEMILCEGQSINGFKVNRIEEDTVELVAENESFVLSLSSD